MRPATPMADLDSELFRTMPRRWAMFADHRDGPPGAGTAAGRLAAKRTSGPAGQTGVVAEARHSPDSPGVRRDNGRDNERGCDAGSEERPRIVTDVAWARRKVEFLRRELLGDPVFRTGVAAIQAQRAARPCFTHLWDSEVQVYSQWGEDGILDYLCDALDIAQPKALELGCGDFRECNTRFLAEFRSAGVTMVDARSDLLRSVRSLPAYWRSTLDPQQAWITPDSVGQLVTNARALHGRIDILSLDIDGNDYWVAEKIDFDGVRIVVLEYQPLFGGRSCITVPRKDDFDRARAHYSHLYYGASLPAFVHLMGGRGFTLVGTNRVGSNAFFIRKEEEDRVSVSLPLAADLHAQKDWTVRESRDGRGHLSYLNGRQALSLIQELPVVDILTGRTLTVGAAI